MHLIEFVLRDLMAIERHAHPATLVVIDDVFPAHPAQAARERRTGIWMGDVWKIAHAIRAHRPELHVMTVDVAPGGLMLIGGLDPTNEALRRAYNPIARTLQVEADPPGAVIEREGSVARDDPRIARMGRILARARETGAPPRAVQRMLREALGAKA